ncbi:hypothetical protein [Hymenobacter profundi]|uniref:Lipocalin-like domain-containing protein n=1 Tax=Hymenobacter profundi TaxID=1982110 RepID=A0ABS6X3T0_9BACT|nr:hypothetical protein [Hymenobacter profundi]MBW3130501.1 hypothetical protein [Hymenobacter profundi]
MKYSDIFSLLLISSTVCSCNPTEQEIIGTYTSPSKKQNIDTLSLFPNGTYSRKLYSTKDGHLIFNNSDLWKYDQNGHIILYSYLLDDDRDYRKEVIEYFTITSSLPVKKRFFSTIKIDCCIENEDIPYYKIKN